MSPQQHTLFEAAKTGVYPKGTTAHDLANCSLPDGHTALHDAAHTGHLPPDTTAEDLAAAIDKSGISALHLAALNNHLPPNTSLTLLANCAHYGGATALEWAFQNGYAPPHATQELLQQTKTNYGKTAWQLLLELAKMFPERIIHLPPHLFKNHTTTATEIAAAAIALHPRNKATAAIWLGHILSCSTQTPQLCL